MHTKSDRPWRRMTAALLVLAIATLGTVGCASAGHLAEYDFADRAVAVVTVAPPRPDVFTGDATDLTGQSLGEALFTIGTGVAKEWQAGRARARLDSAVISVDVATRMAERVLEQGARRLRARPVADGREADFEIDVRIEDYGIEADDWDSQARFFMKAEVLLIERANGRRIWKAGVNESEPVNSGTWGGNAGVDALITAGALARLSVTEIERTLEYLADYTADKVVEKLQKGLDKARGM